MHKNNFKEICQEAIVLLENPICPYREGTSSEREWNQERIDLAKKLKSRLGEI